MFFWVNQEKFNPSPISAPRLCSDFSTSENIFPLERSGPKNFVFQKPHFPKFSDPKYDTSQSGIFLNRFQPKLYLLPDLDRRTEPQKS